ncbi:MAG: hypothetical protein KIS79_14240 [Burkholderiales bacterium]|nr:hypothetical protein [Burkholderiales bacterium]
MKSTKTVPQRYERGDVPGEGPWPLPDHVFHLADAENWRSIQRHGLHSTVALIRLAGLVEHEARAFRDYRAERMRLPSGAVIRDQRPMPPSSLQKCLQEGLTPRDWYDLVNAKVFFWIDQDRLGRHVAACAGRSQMLITIDSRRLLERYGDVAFVTPFNVGNARRRPAPRSERSFVPWKVWMVTRWESEAITARASRLPSHPPAELAIEGSIPDLVEFVIETRPV